MDFRVTYHKTISDSPALTLFEIDYKGVRGLYLNFDVGEKLIAFWVNARTKSGIGFFVIGYKSGSDDKDDFRAHVSPVNGLEEDLVFTPKISLTCRNVIDAKTHAILFRDIYKDGKPLRREYITPNWTPFVDDGRNPILRTEDLK